MAHMDSNCSSDDCQSPRILVFSQRHIYEQEVWRCSFQEFEQTLQKIDSVHVVAPRPKRWYEIGKRVALRVGEKFRAPLNPGIPKVELNQEYDLFFAVIEKPSELLNLRAIEDWKHHCKTSVCWVTEFYVKDIPNYTSCLEMLSKFDHVLFMFNTSEPFNKILGNKGTYLPAGIDALRFCPYPNPPRRSIDVISIGRRSEHIHQALLKMAEREGLFYMYDTINSHQAHNLEQHRVLMANLAKRSRYFLVSPGKFDVPKETGGQSEFGYRYFEAASPGTILLGMRPQNNKEFDRIFNWRDAVIDVPFDSNEICAVIRELDMQPQRQIAIRRDNMEHCLLHHDWAYRWESVLSLAGLDPFPRLLERKKMLRERAATVQSSEIEP